jgi:hypothetical protein
MLLRVLDISIHQIKKVQMKSFILSMILFLSCLTLFSQDEVRTLSDYHALEVAGGISIDLHQGNPRAEITILKGDLENLKTVIKSGELRVYFDNKKWGRSNGNNKAKIDLYFNSLDEISVAAGATLQCDELLHADDFDADASSGSRMELNIEARSITSDVSSGASLTINGETKELDIDVSSGGAFNGTGLKSKKVNADASSGGSAKVWATESIDADASSGGAVRYKGEPTKENLSPSKWSGGNVSKI